MNLVQQTSHR